MKLKCVDKNVLNGVSNEVWNQVWEQTTETVYYQTMEGVRHLVLAMAAQSVRELVRGQIHKT